MAEILSSHSFLICALHLQMMAVLLSSICRLYPKFVGDIITFVESIPNVHYLNPNEY